MQTAYTVLILLMLVGVSRLVARVIPLPLPLLQIAAGAILAWPTLGLHVALEPELFLFLFLPPLLFSDGWRIPKRDLWHYRGPVLMLAVGLVLFTVLGAGYFIHWLLPDIPLPVAFALAAVLSPTDAVAVSAIAQDRLPTPLMRILQGEALMNDASGLVTFKFALAAAITGVFSLADASVTFVLVAVGGLALGVLLSWVVGRLRVWMIARGWDDPATHVVFMLLLPFAAYVLAERLGASGILSAVAAGMMQSWLDLLPRQTRTRILNRSVWALLEFAFNGLIFLLLGLQLPDIVKAVISHEPTLWPALSWRCLEVLAIFGILLLLRFVWVQSTWRAISWVRRLRGKTTITRLPDARSCALLTLGGVRGAVTLAGVMSVPLLMAPGQAFPQRDLLILSPPVSSCSRWWWPASLCRCCCAESPPAMTRVRARKCAMPGATPPNRPSVRWKRKTRRRRPPNRTPARPHWQPNSRRASCPSTGSSWRCSKTPPKPRRWPGRWTNWNATCVSRPCVRNAWRCMKCVDNARSATTSCAKCLPNWT